MKQWTVTGWQSRRCAYALIVEAASRKTAKLIGAWQFKAVGILPVRITAYPVKP